MELLLLSNSTNHGRGYLEHALTEVADFLSGVRKLIFVPYALADHPAYTAMVASALEPLGIEVVGLQDLVGLQADQRDVLADAGAVFVGGGNTFRLLKTLQQRTLVEPLSAAVRAGKTRYMGASAGTNIAGGSIRTTNDMPIVEPESFVALGLVPFQINPHYVDADPQSTHGGETREKRITEFVEENDVPVVGLREGTWLRVSNSQARIGGQSVAATSTGPAVVFARGQQLREVSEDVDWLLESEPRFDV